MQCSKKGIGISAVIINITDYYHLHGRVVGRIPFATLGLGTTALWYAKR
jgi:hypothetical protein